MCGIWQLFYNKVINLKTLFNNIQSRGPDNSKYIISFNTTLGFHRLAINDLSNNGMQPFFYNYKNYSYSLLCNGEIYNYKKLLSVIKYNPISKSDCEVLLPYFIYCNNDIESFLNNINGEFSMILTITNNNDNSRKIYIATDPLGLRPLFYQYYDTGLLISSLLKGLSKDYKSYRLLQGQYIEYIQKSNGMILINSSNIYHKYNNILNINLYENINLYYTIVNCLTNCVDKRIVSNRPLCCLLSGGLDSSLIAAITQKLLKQYSKNNILHTFSIGMVGGSTDLKYAKIVADYIGSVHTEIYYTEEEALNIVDEVIYECETYDITTIRASIPQYILAKYIKNNTEFKVILNGDGADEIAMGYLYFYNSPCAEISQTESIQLIKYISRYDGLRVDRTLSSNGLEARFPFLDKEFVNLYLNIDAKLKIPTQERMEKYLLRKAFREYYLESPLLPDEILWRKKEAFSDGVSNINNSWYKILNNFYKNKNIENKIFEHLQPISEESMYYRIKFEEFFGKNAEKCIPHFWLPKWSNTNDPSARTLNIYNNV